MGKAYLVAPKELLAGGEGAFSPALSREPAETTKIGKEVKDLSGVVLRTC